MRDQRSPWLAKAVLVLTVACVFGSIDLSPDFISVTGLADVPVFDNKYCRLVLVPFH